MTPLAGPFYAFALLLVAAGAAKLVDPRSTAGALQATRLPAGFSLVRLLGGVEVVIGAGALASGDRWFAGLLALAYLAFAGFVGYALARKLPVASCGCFAKPDTPPTVAHLVITSTAAVLGAALTLRPLGPPTAVLDGQPGGGLPFALATLVAAYLLFVVLTDLARTMGRVSISRRAGGAPS